MSSESVDSNLQPKQRDSGADGKSEKSKAALALAFTAFMAGCGDNPPSPDTVQTYLESNPEAERIEVGKIRTMETLFEQFRLVANEKVGQAFDVRDPQMIQRVEKQPNYFYSHKVRLIDNSTVEIKRVLEKKSGRPLGGPYETQYSFGPERVEIKMGTLLSIPERPNDDIPSIYSVIDVKTGVITAFKRNDWGSDNSFRLSDKGTMEVGGSYKYHPNLATDIVKIAIEDFQALRRAIKEKEGVRN